MRQISKRICSNTGASLIEVMVAFGIMGIVVLAGSSLNSAIANTTMAAKAQNNYQQFVTLVRSRLQYSDICLSTFGASGGNVAPVTLDPLVDAGWLSTAVPGGTNVGTEVKIRIPGIQADANFLGDHVHGETAPGAGDGTILPLLGIRADRVYLKNSVPTGNLAVPLGTTEYTGEFFVMVSRLTNLNGSPGPGLVPYLIGGMVFQVNTNGNKQITACKGSTNQSQSDACLTLGCQYDSTVTPPCTCPTFLKGCPRGQYLTGTNPDGSLTCKVWGGVDCPPGQYVVGVGLETTYCAALPVILAKVDGTCAPAGRGGTFANAAAVTAAGLCAPGTASIALADPGPWSWDCIGSGGGTSTSGGLCTANAAAVPVNGLCGPAAAGGPYATAAAVTAAGLCAPGTATALAGTGPWTWDCNGLNGGAPTLGCLANLAAAPVLCLVAVRGVGPSSCSGPITNVISCLPVADPTMCPAVCDVPNNILTEIVASCPAAPVCGPGSIPATNGTCNITAATTASGAVGAGTCSTDSSACSATCIGPAWAAAPVPACPAAGGGGTCCTYTRMPFFGISLCDPTLKGVYWDPGDGADTVAMGINACFSAVNNYYGGPIVTRNWSPPAGVCCTTTVVSTGGNLTSSNFKVDCTDGQTYNLNNAVCVFNGSCSCTTGWASPPWCGPMPKAACF